VWLFGAFLSAFVAGAGGARRAGLGLLLAVTAQLHRINRLQVGDVPCGKFNIRRHGRAQSLEGRRDRAARRCQGHGCEAAVFVRSHPLHRRPTVRHSRRRGANATDAALYPAARERRAALLRRGPESGLLSRHRLCSRFGSQQSASSHVSQAVGLHVSSAQLDY